MLTDKQCKNAVCPPEKKRARFTDALGVYLEVSPAGSKRWFWKTYADGKEGRMALGSYPAMGLADARKARDAAKLQKAGGVDPVQARKVEKLKATNPAGNTFKVVALEWFGKQKPNGATHTQSARCASSSAIFSPGWENGAWLKLNPWSCWLPCARWRSAARWRLPTGA